jgi:hypothetical protein
LPLLKVHPKDFGKLCGGTCDKPNVLNGNHLGMVNHGKPVNGKVLRDGKHVEQLAYHHFLWPMGNEN